MNCFAGRSHDADGAKLQTPVTLLFRAYLLAADASAQTIRVATYNVNWGNRRGDQVIDAIRTANADVLCLQGVCHFAPFD